MPLQNRVTPFGDLAAVAGARVVLSAIAAGAFTPMQNTDGAALGVAAMDLLRARFQGPPARCLGPLLHRAVFSRRADRARGRASALLRMPPQGCRDICRSVARGAQASNAGPKLPRWMKSCTTNGCAVAPNACIGQHRRSAGRRIRRAGGRSLRDPRRRAAALDAGGLRGPQKRRAASRSTCSPRRRFSRRCRPAISRNGILARRISS